MGTHKGFILAAASLDGKVYIFNWDDLAKLNSYSLPLTL
jgi:hypothetical protein